GFGLAYAISQRRTAAARERASFVEAARQEAGASWQAFLAGRNAPRAGAEHDASLGLALDAMQAATRVVTLVPEDPAAREHAFETSVALGEVAEAEEQWGLACSAFEKALDLGVDEDRAAAALAEAERGRTRVLDNQRASIERLLTRARSGELAAIAGAYEDALFEIVGYREAQTVELLVEALLEATSIIERASQDLHVEAARHLARARGDDEEELALRMLEALEKSHAGEDHDGEELLLAAHGHFEESYVRSLSEDAAARHFLPDGRGHIASAQTHALDPGGALLVRLCSDVLGRLPMSHAELEGAIEPLGRYMRVEEDPHRGIVAGRALCLIGSDAALRHVFARGRQLGEKSVYWRQVSRHVGRARARAATFEAVTAADFLDRGILAHEDRAYDEAIVDFTRALEIDPGSSDAYRRRGNSLKKLERWDDAIADLDQSITFAPTNADAYITRGSVYEKRDLAGDMERALEDYLRATEVAPRYSRAWKNLADGYREAEQPTLALETYAKALRIEPRYARAWYKRGELHTDLGQFHEALADLDRAVFVDPDMPNAWDARAVVKRELGDWFGALEDHARAVALEPKEAEWWESRAETRARSGDPAGAEADLDRARELGSE
ncbi:MAG: tetratricopeptide repeat protein, partial [Planctomycetota bacterium]